MPNQKEKKMKRLHSENFQNSNTDHSVLIGTSNLNRRDFIKNALLVGGSLVLSVSLPGCDGLSCKNPVAPKKEKLTTILDVGYSDNKDNFKPDGYIDVLFSSPVDSSTLIPKNFPITGMGKTIFPKLDYENKSPDKVRLTMPNLVPGRHDYFIAVNNIKDAKGRLVDVDNDGKQGGSYQVGLKTIEATKVTSISNISHDNVPIKDISIYLKFNNPLDKSKVTLDNIIIHETSSKKNLIKQVHYDNGSLKIDLNELKWFTEYELRIKKSVRDKWGFELNGKGDEYPPAEDFTYKFKTAQKPDLVPPTILSVNPVDGSIGVDVSTVVKIKFSEPVKHENLEQLLELRDSNNNRVQGIYKYNSNVNIISFKPSNKFQYNTQYKILVKNIKDMFDNKMPDAEFNFTTEVSPSEQTPQKLEYLIAEKGDNLKETKLRFKVPADKSKTGSVEDGTNLSYIIYRSEKPINNESDLRWGRIIKNNYKPGLRTGEEVELVIENPEAAKMYYYAVKVKDQDGNVSQMTSSNGVLSRGFAVKGKLSDALTKENYIAKIIVANEKDFSYDYDTGMKIDQSKIKNIFSTNPDGSFEIEVSSLTEDALLFTATENQGDEGIIDILVPTEYFKWKKEHENIDMVDIFAVDKTYNMGRWLRITTGNPRVTETDPKASIWNTGYDPVMYQTRIIDGKPVRVIKSTIVHSNSLEQEFTAPIIREVYQKVSEVLHDASDGKYKLQNYDEARKINEDFGNKGNERKKEVEFFNRNGPYPGFMWFATQYYMAAHSYNNSYGFDIYKLYATLTGGVTQYYTSLGTFYEECLTGLFNMAGEVNYDKSWRRTIFYGGGSAIPNTVIVNYRNKEFGAETYIARLKFKTPTGSVMRPKGIYYYPLVNISGKDTRLPTYKGD